MSEIVQIPRPVWENILHDLAFMKKAIMPLAKGYKPAKWMDEEEVMEYLKIGKERLKQLRASKQIRVNKVGRCIDYWRADIEDYKQGNIIIQTNKKAPAATDAHS